MKLLWVGTPISLTAEAENQLRVTVEVPEYRRPVPYNGEPINF